MHVQSAQKTQHFKRRSNVNEHVKLLSAYTLNDSKQAIANWYSFKTNEWLNFQIKKTIKFVPSSITKAVSCRSNPAKSVYARSKLDTSVYWRLKSFWLRFLTVFNTQRSRRRKTTPYEETDECFGYMVMEGRHKAMKYKAGNLKSVTKTFF